MSLDNEICLYCKQKLKTIEIDVWNRSGFNVLFCNACKIRYIYYSDFTLATHTMYTKINGRFYSASLQYIKQGKIFIRCNAIDTNDFEEVISNPFSDKKVLELPSSVKITPKNINSKIKIYLLFL